MRGRKDDGEEGAWIEGGQGLGCLRSAEKSGGGGVESPGLGFPYPTQHPLRIGNAQTG